MTAAAEQVDQELERQWEERTRPSRDAPRVNSSYLRKDYAAACPQQHVRYLKCLRDATGFTNVNACQDEYKAFAICKERAKAANMTPVEHPVEETSTAQKLWQDLQREPLYIAAKMSVQDALQRLGFSSSDHGSTDSSSNGSIGSSNGGSNGGSKS